MKNFKVLLCGLLFSAMFSLSVKAQANDLMIVEYVDWSSGSGFAVELYNPTGSAIDLGSGYRIMLFFNGGTSPTNNVALSGIIPAGGTFIVGNSAYCSTECPGTCDFQSGTLSGVNGNDAVAITNGNFTGSIATTNFVDMIGVPGIAVGPNGTSQMVNGTNNGLFRTRIERATSNTTRYSETDGIYNNNTTPDSWPGDQTTNVIGWNVFPASCIIPGYSTLPVELVDFEAKSLEARSTKLSWTTASESNNYGFNIERSLDASGSFKTVGFVQGNGTTSAGAKYNFTDQGLEPGLYYYRLRQVDYNNDVRYSQVLAVQVFDTNHLNWYPNPGSGLVNLEIRPGNYHLQLLDSRGALVLDRQLFETDTYQPVSLDFQDQPSGVFHYIVVGEDGNRFSGRLVKK